MILAADVADDLEWRGVNAAVAEVVQLSNQLRAARYHPMVPRPENFRSPGSVGMKINNLRRSHPAHVGIGLRATVAESDVVQLFLEDRRTMKAVAGDLRSRIAKGSERLGDAREVLQVHGMR